MEQQGRQNLNKRVRQWEIFCLETETLESGLIDKVGTAINISPSALEQAYNFIETGEMDEDLYYFTRWIYYEQDQVN